MRAGLSWSLVSEQTFIMSMERSRGLTGGGGGRHNYATRLLSMPSYTLVNGIFHETNAWYM